MIRKLTIEEQERIIKDVHRWLTPIGKVNEITLDGANIDKFILEIYCKGRKEMWEETIKEESL